MKREFKVGDKCVFRQWDDMAQEYGEIGGDIGCWPPFTKYMKYLCGQSFTVSEVKDGKYYSQEGLEYTRLASGIAWSITAAMLEYAEDDEPVQVPDFSKFLA